MIELSRRQLDFGDGLIAEEVGELWEDWMRHVDAVLDGRGEQCRQRMAQCYRRLMMVTQRVLGQACRFVREMILAIKRCRRRRDGAVLLHNWRYLETMIPRVRQALQ